MLISFISYLLYQTLYSSEVKPGKALIFTEANFISAFPGLFMK